MKNPTPLRYHLLGTELSFGHIAMAAAFHRLQSAQQEEVELTMISGADGSPVIQIYDKHLGEIVRTIGLPCKPEDFNYDDIPWLTQKVTDVIHDIDDAHIAHR